MGNTNRSELRAKYERLRAHIANEPRPLAFSDQELAEILSKELRERVTYNRVYYWRRELGIQNARQRKRGYQHEQQTVQIG